MFGRQNATITAIYVAESQTTTIYGSRVLDSPVVVSHRGWFEETRDERREVGGDSMAQQARFITNYSENLDTGNVLTIAPDRVGNESAAAARNWKVENRAAPSGFTGGCQRIRRIELSLRLEV